MNRDDAIAELQKKLDPAHVKPAPKGKFGEYIEGVHAIYEANRIFGHFDWSYRVTRMQMVSEQNVSLSGSNGDYEQYRVGYLCTVLVTVDGVEREGTAVGSGVGNPNSIADHHESACKEAETDALKRALRTFGNPFGLALYDKTKSNVGVDFDEFAEADRIKAEITNAATKDALTKIWDANKSEMSKMCEDVFNSVRTAFKTAGQKLSEPDASEMLSAG